MNSLARSYSFWAMRSRAVRVCGINVDRDNAKHCAAVAHCARTVPPPWSSLVAGADFLPTETRLRGSHVDAEFAKLLHEPTHQIWIECREHPLGALEHRDMDAGA